MIIKTYEVSFAYGIINPIEKRIEIETINDITEEFIISEIEKKNPKYKGQISCIFSYILKREKVIETKLEQEEIKEDTSIPKFNW